MNQFSKCYIEQRENDLWYICWPDCTKAIFQGYKSRGSAQRTLNQLTT